MPVDLHCHSNISDGSFSPSELVRLFAANNVTVVALTDHDTVGGREEFLGACSLKKITGIVGAEFSTVLSDGTETHILGYGIPPANPKWISFIERHQEYLRNRLTETLKKLSSYGFNVSIDECYCISRGNPPMPPHIMTALAYQGRIHNLNEAVDFFIEYMATNAKAWVPHETQSASVLASLRDIGIVPIISHPARYPGIDRIEELIEMGAMGFELYYPEQTGEPFDRLVSIAKKHACLVTGGCDFHGAFAERRVREVEVPRSAAEALFKAIGEDLPDL
jgi:3',5'-nucleoside bisphosphate phosphatase